MKPIKVMTSAALAAMVFSAGGFSVFAADETTPTIGGDYNTTGTIEFIPSTDPSTPVDPTDPDTPVTPEGPGTNGTTGPLSIDFVSSFDFGTQKISSQDQVYQAKAQKITKKVEGEDQDLYVPNYAQVTDNRGTEAGWTLSVIQNDDFIADSNNSHTLAGSQIVISNVAADSVSDSGLPSNVPTGITLDGADDVTSVVMAAKADEGAGTHVAKFGKDEVASAEEYLTENVVLKVPGSTTKYKDTYTTSITWTLSDTPANAE